MQWKHLGLVLILCWIGQTDVWCDVPSGKPAIPSISSLMKTDLWKRLVNEREIIMSARLADVPGEEVKKYSFYAAMLVKSSVAQSREVLTDYKLYSEMVPYVDQSLYSPLNHILKIAGGIWNFKLSSEVLFDEPEERWIHYRIVNGHFSGLSGDIYFESLREKGTAIYMKGEQIGKNWPPQFIIERGAEIVFGFTANRMRSYIEAQKKKVEKGAVNGEQQRQQIGPDVPQPRSHL